MRPHDGHHDKKPTLIRTKPDKRSEYRDVMRSSDLVTRPLSDFPETGSHPGGDEPIRLTLARRNVVN